MKKSSITGWQDVFSFTLIQTLKSKTFVITTVVMIVLALASMPLMSFITGSSTETDPNAPSPINKVYVKNESSLPDLKYQTILEQPAFSHISFEAANEEITTMETRIEEEENDSVILTITEEGGIYSLSFAKATKGPIGDNQLALLGNAVSAAFDSNRIQALGITPEQDAMLKAPITTKVSLLNMNGDIIEKKDTSISNSEYWFIYGILFIVLMITTLSGSQIATSIVIEKSTRVVEYLLTSIRPLALIIGKVLAMLLAVILQMVTLVLSAFLSNKLTASLLSGNGDSLLSQYLPEHIFQNLNAVNIIICFVLIILGLIFYATLAGLAGATVSKMEEINEGVTLQSFIVIIGAYIAIAAAASLMGAGDSAYVTFSYLFPLSTPFILPGAILIGKASLFIAGVAFVLQLIFIILLFLFVAKVYETLILHNGNAIKPKQLIKIARNSNS